MNVLLLVAQRPEAVRDGGLRRARQTSGGVSPHAAGTLAGAGGRPQESAVVSQRAGRAVDRRPGSSSPSRPGADAAADERRRRTETARRHGGDLSEGAGPDRESLRRWRGRGRRSGAGQDAIGSHQDAGYRCFSEPRAVRTRPRGIDGQEPRRVFAPAQIDRRSAGDSGWAAVGIIGAASRYRRQRAPYGGSERAGGHRARGLQRRGVSDSA